MASDVPSPQSGFLQDGVNLLFPDGKFAASPVVTLAIIALPVVVLLLKKILYPTFDVREPPVLRPRIPFFGHVVSLMRESSAFYARLYKERALPICTLPMLAGKMYVINSPTLISAAMRNKNISFDPFIVEFSAGALGLAKSTVDIYSTTSVVEEMTALIHTALMGEPLHKMNAVALDYVADRMNEFKPDSIIEIPNVYDWLRNLMSMATWRALFGEENPLGPDAIPLMWEYEQGLILLVMNMAPSLIAKKALAARTKMQEKLRPFYTAHLDQGPTVSEITKRRAEMHRREGITDDEVSILELTMPWVATTNTIPALFWLFVNVFSQPDRVERIRNEVIALTTITEKACGRIASVEFTKLEKTCPYLMGSYREALRLYNDNTGNRRVMVDTVIRDADGTEYLLKGGTNVQWTAGVNQLNEAHFGDDVMTFNPERWINPPAQQEKRQRTVMIPFGGGKNLCPGRNFALAENLGFIGAFALGFDVTGVSVPPANSPLPGGAMRLPNWGSIGHNIGIQRRVGWEDVEWKFIL